jgi:hypothetical protein
MSALSETCVSITARIISTGHDLLGAQFITFKSQFMHSSNQIEHNRRQQYSAVGTRYNCTSAH